MKKLKYIIFGIFIFLLSGCTGVTPRATAGLGLGVNIDFHKKAPVIRPYIGGGMSIGAFRFF